MKSLRRTFVQTPLVQDGMRLVKRMRDEEDGITALETAIILIAFVVVASVFAFTMLSAGIFSTERGKEAIYAGLTEVQSTLEIRGSVIAKATPSTSTTSGTVESLIFSLGNALNGEPVDLSKVVFEYRDDDQRVPISGTTNISIGWLGEHNGNGLLEPGEQAEVEVTIDSALLEPDLQTNMTFVLEVKPPTGAVMVIQRTTPPWLEAVNDLK